MTGKTHKSIYYHITFATRGRQPLLNAAIKEQVFHFIRNKCKRLGLYLHSIGGIQDHIHMLIYIPPKLAVADAVGQIKGSSSFFVNKELAGDSELYWQHGYCVITVSEDNFQRVNNYIENQEDHHQGNSLWNELEDINQGVNDEIDESIYANP